MPFPPVCLICLLFSCFMGQVFECTLTLQLLTRPEKLQWLQWLQGFSIPSNAESLYLQSMEHGHSGSSEENY
jgi:hypothetical protein